MGGCEPPDGCLVGEALSGDAGAFAVLYRRHARAVRGVVAARVRNREDVADLVQEVFARAMGGLAMLREPDRFRSWVLTIARHATIDHGRAPPSPSTLGADGEPEPRESDPEPGDLAELADLVERVRGCVAGLSARDATVLSLITQFGFSHVEVGRALGISPGAAKVVLHRARGRLRNALALTLLAEDQASACPAFREAYEHGRLSLAGAHVASCPRCITAVNREVHLYAAGRR